LISSAPNLFFDRFFQLSRLSSLNTPGSEMPVGSQRSERLSHRLIAYHDAGTDDRPVVALAAIEQLVRIDR
jgi:hypothetical protein